MPHDGMGQWLLLGLVMALGLARSTGQHDPLEVYVTYLQAASRTIGDDFASEPRDSGVDSGRPTVQSRLGFGRGTDERPHQIGVSAHWGVEDLSADFGRPDFDLPSWSTTLDLLGRPRAEPRALGEHLLRRHTASPAQL